MQVRLGILACLALPLILTNPVQTWAVSPPQTIVSQQQGLTNEAPSLTVDRDPAPSIDPDNGAAGQIGSEAVAAGVGKVSKGENGRYTLEANAYEVELHVTVLDKNGRPAQNLQKDAFRVFENGVPQVITGFHHDDPAVSIGLLIDNSASMFDKREAVEKAALHMIRLSNPKDEEFLVDFSSKPYLDVDFTSSVDKLQQGLKHVNARGGTAAFDAVVASADYLSKHGKDSKRVLVLITDGEDNASRTSMAEVIKRVQNLEGPVIYCIGLLFGQDADKTEVQRARAQLKEMADETGGAAFFPRSLKDVDTTASIVAEDIRTQYTIGYRSTDPPSNGGYRAVHVDAIGNGNQKLNVRTRKGYIPKIASATQAAENNQGNGGD